MKKLLPPRPSLEHLKKQAKDLLKSWKSGSEPTDRPCTLNEAQTVLARSYGFGSWPRLKLGVEAANAPLGQRVALFVSDALGVRPTRASETLISEPEVVRVSLEAACVACDLKAIRRHLRKQEVGEPTGHQGWTPLELVCFSKIPLVQPSKRKEAAKCARLLLEGGADPNAAHFAPPDDRHPLPVLYGAAGVQNNPALVELLLEAGANPNDNESLYHAAEHRQHDCLRLLLEANATIEGTNAVLRMLDYEDIEGVKLLLKHGADPNHRDPLNHAVIRGRSKEIVQLLLDHGADVKKSMAKHSAVARGRTDLFQLLAPGEHFPEPTDLGQYLGDACSVGDTHRVKRALALGASPNLPDPDGRQGLHHAAFWGHADVARILIEAGANPNSRDRMYNGMPLGFMVHGVWAGVPDSGDRVLCAKELINAGATVESWMLEVDDEALRIELEAALTG